MTVNRVKKELKEEYSSVHSNHDSKEMEPIKNGDSNGDDGCENEAMLDTMKTKDEIKIKAESESEMDDEINVHFIHR